MKMDHPFVAKVIYKMNQLATDGFAIHLAMSVSKETSKLIGL